MVHFFHKAILKASQVLSALPESESHRNTYILTVQCL